MARGPDRQKSLATDLLSFVVRSGW